jgi:1-acyl-sn-glycerol-3-phosphate acyltransferase
VFYWLMKHWVIGPLLTTVFRPWVKGLENVPRTGPLIVVCNHLSLVDSVFLPLMIDRQMAFLAKSDYFTGKGIKGWFIRFFMTSAGQLPIDRSGGKSVRSITERGPSSSCSRRSIGDLPRGDQEPGWSDVSRANRRGPHDS